MICLSIHSQISEGVEIQTQCSLIPKKVPFHHYTRNDGKPELLQLFNATLNQQWHAHNNDFIMLADSMGKEFGQDSAGMATLWSMMSKATAGDAKRDTSDSM